jgi:hypothetical protein
MLTESQYYKPWELLPEHEDQIKRQIEEAQATINEELDEFEHKHRGQEVPSNLPAPTNTMDENMENAPTITHVELQEDNDAKQDREPDVSTLTNEQPDLAAGDQESKPEHEHSIEEQPATAGAEAVANTEQEAEAEILDEHHGEMVVEAEEDTVIY